MRSYNGANQADLNAALTGMNASAGLTAETAGANAALGNTAAVNTAALGTSTAQRMAQEAMAANTYAGLQPTFAAAEGGRNLGMFQSDLNAGMREDLGNVTAQLPEMILSVYQNLANQNQQTRAMKQQRGETMTSAYNDMNTRNLNAAIAQAAIRENTARMLGDQSNAYLSALTSLTNQQTASGADTGDPYSIVAEAAANAAEHFYSDPNFNVDIYNAYNKDELGNPGNKQRSWAWWNPGKALAQIKANISSQAKGKLPPALVNQYAIQTMINLGLRTPAMAAADKKAKGGKPSSPAAGPIVGNAGDAGDVTGFPPGVAGASGGLGMPYYWGW
jgi:hypothetical protein